MVLNKSRRWVYWLTYFWVVLLFGIGSWWLYLAVKMNSMLSELNLVDSHARFVNMAKWEGGFFFLLLFLIGGTLFGMYMRDMRKSKAMQIFFSSLSHELKTPLASMRLQAEVIKDLIEDETHSHDQLSELTGRLIEDTHKLESELEKSLQLSRIEQDAPLSLAPVSLERYLKRHQQKLLMQLDLKISAGAQEVLADEMALNMIFRNLFENTLRHQSQSKKILITARRHTDRVEVIYDDFGNAFTGDVKKLGEIFYKHNSAKGSGIGLYLIKQLMHQMHGELNIEARDHLRFHLTFRAPNV